MPQKLNVLTKNKPGRKAKKRKEREKVMRSYMEGKKYRENKGESAIMEKMKKYIKSARGKIFFSFYAMLFNLHFIYLYCHNMALTMCEFMQYICKIHL